ncbi:MAG: hypothetical protein H7Z10_02210, partial [Gemmatimonadaceae bacterium]|nr:hypothetical protein [Acetobacteraceae bacterium]
MVAISPTGMIGRNVRMVVAPIGTLATGGSLEWIIAASGLGGIGDLRLLAELGDGQRMSTAFRPQVALRRGGGTIFEGELLGWTGVRGAEAATTALNFDLALTLRAANLPGGVTDDTTVEIRFRSTILTQFAARVPPPNGRTVGQGDLLRNDAHYTGTVGGSLRSSDPTVAQAALPTSVLATSIYAVNGVVGAVSAAAGDVVTYRMRLTLPLGSARDVHVVASAPGFAGTFVFDGGAGTPPAGQVRLGPASTIGATPVVSGTAGTLRLDFGDIQSAGTSGTVDLLVSAALPAGAIPTLQATVTEATAFGTEATAAAPPVAAALIEPFLTLQIATLYASNDNATWTGTGGPFGYDPFFGQFGGVISSDGLDGEAFDDRLSGIDAGDEVTFVIAVQNRAGAPAHDLVIRATVPSDFIVPADGGWLSVTDGAGTPIAVTGDLFDPLGGLAIDPATPLARYDGASGFNVLLLTYTLRTSDRFVAGAPARASTGTIVNYAAQPGSANRAAIAPATAMT